MLEHFRQVVHHLLCCVFFGNRSLTVNSKLIRVTVFASLGIKQIQHSRQIAFTDIQPRQFFYFINKSRYILDINRLRTIGQFLNSNNTFTYTRKEFFDIRGRKIFPHCRVKRIIRVSQSLDVVVRHLSRINARIFRCCFKRLFFSNRQRIPCGFRCSKRRFNVLAGIYSCLIQLIYGVRNRGNICFCWVGVRVNQIKELLQRRGRHTERASEVNNIVRCDRNTAVLPIYLHHAVNKSLLVFAECVIFLVKCIESAGQILSDFIFIFTGEEETLVFTNPLFGFFEIYDLTNEQLHLSTSSISIDLPFFDRLCKLIVNADHIFVSFNIVC